MVVGLHVVQTKYAMDLNVFCSEGSNNFYRIVRHSFTTRVGTAVTELVDRELILFLFFENYIEQVCK